MLTITDNAAEAVRQISAGSGLAPDPGLRISVGVPTPEGTPLELSLAAEPLPTDQTVDQGGAHVYLEGPVAAALDDKVLDAEFDGTQVRFELRDAAAGDTPGSANGNAPGI
jgi:Fe-S cluster assembly iron-binding protein IscA